MVFTCQVCFEEKSVRLSLPRLATGNGDVLREKDCEHPVCQDCLSTFVSTRISEQRVFQIRCPVVGCTCEIFEQDVQRLLQAGVLTTEDSERFAELRSRDYSARRELLTVELTENIASNDFASIKRMWQTMRFCPRCNLAIERSQGCNSFYCTCGHHFDFATAPRVIGDGVGNFSKVIDVAETLGVPLAVAESFGKDSGPLGKPWSAGRALNLHRNVSKIAHETGAEFEEALRLQQQARNGSEEARARIRDAKQRHNTTLMQNAEEDEEEELYSLAWDSLTAEVELDILEKDVDIASHAQEQSDEEEQVKVMQNTDEDMQVSLVPVEQNCEGIANNLWTFALLCPEMLYETYGTNTTESRA